MGGFRYPKNHYKHLLNSIYDKDGDRCFRIGISFDDKSGGKYLVIGRNPYRVQDGQCNKVTKRIFKYFKLKICPEEKVRELIMVNLFAAHDLNSDMINRKLDKNYKHYIVGNRGVIGPGDVPIRNDEVIKNAIRESQKIMLAWGEPIKGMETLYNERIESVLRILRECILEAKEEKKVFVVGEMSLRGYPRHPLSWSFRDNLNEY